MSLHIHVAVDSVVQSLWNYARHSFILSNQ